MKKTAFIADVHIGNHQRHKGETKAGINRRCDITLDVLYNACELVCEHNCNALVVVGDLCHSDKMSPQIVTQIQDIIPPEGITTYLLPGNHDQSSFAASDHALGPQKDCHVIDSPYHSGFVDAWMFPYRKGKVTEWLPKELKKCVEKCSSDKLVAHFGISNSATPDYLVQQSDSINVDDLASICNRYGIKYVFAGHWHNRAMWEKQGVTIIQIGALCPTGWKDPGLEGYGRVFILSDNGKLEEYEIPGPRFVSIEHASWNPEWQKEFAKQRDKGSSIYLELITKPSNVLELHKQLQKAVERGLYAAVDVFPAYEETAREARRAAIATQNTDDLLEALTTYVQKKPLKSENVGRNEVLERTKGYLDI